MKERNEIIIIKIIAIINLILLILFGAVELRHKEIDSARDYDKDYYAIIESISENNYVYVKRRKSYKEYESGLTGFPIDEDTEIVYKNRNVDATELKVGQKILVDFTGMIFLTIPAQIDKVDKIEILDE